MSDIESAENNIGNSTDDKSELIFKQFEAFAYERKYNNGFDVASLNEEQVNTALQLYKEEQDKAHEYRMAKLKSDADIKKLKIDTSQTDRKTYRYVILSAIVAIFSITGFVFAYKEQYIGTWLSFMTGTLAGIGIGKSNLLSKPSDDKATN